MRKNNWRRGAVLLIAIFLIGILAFASFGKNGQNLALAQNSRNVKPTPMQEATVNKLQNSSCSSGNHSAVEHCSMNGIHVIKINLNDPNITIKPVIAPNGGLASLSSLAGSDGIAVINGDYRLGNCNNGVNCGEGLTYIYGTNYTMGPPDTYNYRRSLAFNQSLDPHIGYPSEQGGYLWNVIGGGPRFTENGTFQWVCGDGSQNHDCPNQNGTVVINNEYFGSSATNWWNRPQSAIGFSSDGNTIYLAASEGNVTMQSLHDVLWQFGSRNNLKLDGGSARSLYYNDGSGHYLYLGSGILEPNAWVITESSSPPPTGEVKLWSHANFEGNIVWSGGTGFSNDPNADSYSMEMPSGWSVKTWREDNRGGGERCWSSSVNNLQDHGWHLAIRSIEVFNSNVCSPPPPPNCNPNDDQIALFVDSDYGGQCVVKGIGEYSNPSSIGLPNDSISSVKVGSNVQAVLCEHDNYGGTCETFAANDTNLSDNNIGNDRVSSAKVETRCQNQVSVVGIWTADGSWNNKTIFDPGNPIQWIISIENKTCGNADIDLTYDVVGPSGQQVAYWDGTVTTQPGTWFWGLPGTVSEDVGGIISFTGTGDYQGQISQANTTYQVTIAVEIDVEGNNQSIPDGDTDPTPTDNTDFGGVDVSNGSITKVFKIQNEGNSNLTLTGSPKVDITGIQAGDFVVTTQPSSPIAPGSETTFEVTFNSSELGLRTATVNIQNNDSNENPYNFVIQGSGIKETDNQIPIWKALLLVYSSIDTDYTDGSGASQHLTYTMSQTEISDGVNAFRRYASLTHNLSNAEAFVQYDIFYITRPIDTLTSMGTNMWWPSPSDTRQELDLYAPPGKYDSVLVLWPQSNPDTGQSIPSGGWGLGLYATSWANNATYATVANAPTWIWNTPSIGEPWLHEWLHGVCPFYVDRGFPMPDGGADGGGSHGYVWSSTTGWADYYGDLMTGNVLEDGELKGITAEAWGTGSIIGASAHIFADYFKYDTLSGYEKTGSWIWNSESENIRTDGVPGSDSRMYAPIAFEQKFTVIGRVFIPASGVGPYDSIAVALRNDQVEYWATLAYGTSLIERNHISIMRNDTWGDLYPLNLAPGWYTAKIQIDQQNEGAIRLKVWADGNNEPNWQVIRELDPGWTITGIGYRHAGDGTTWVDDIYLVGSRYYVYIPLVTRP